MEFSEMIALAREGIWPSSSARNKRRAEDSRGLARVTAEDFLMGRISGQQFLAAMHAIGHDGPGEIQDLVELDDEYDQAMGPDVEKNFCSDRIMELLVRRARELATAS